MHDRPIDKQTNIFQIHTGVHTLKCANRHKTDKKTHVQREQVDQEEARDVVKGSGETARGGWRGKRDKGSVEGRRNV